MAEARDWRHRPGRVAATFRRFVRAESAGGVVLLLAALIALLWANSPWGYAYARLWQTDLSLGVGNVRLTETLLHWVNDGLMAIFFLAIGLEIKRELVAGELARPRRATLPAAATPDCRRRHPPDRQRGLDQGASRRGGPTTCR